MGFTELLLRYEIMKNINIMKMLPLSKTAFERSYNLLLTLCMRHATMLMKVDLQLRRDK